MRILVTGGAGFIGSHTAEELSRRGHAVRVVDDLSTGKMENLAGFERGPDRVPVNDVVIGDLLDPRVLADAVKGMDVVAHLAARPLVADSVEDPETAHARGSHLTLLVLDAARRAGVRRVVCASSASVYGNGESPQREGAPLSPLSPYAATKAAGEQYCAAFARCYEMDTVSLRFFNAYGPRQPASSPYAGAIAKFCEAAAAGRDLTVHGSGRQSRDMIFVGDVAEAVALAAEKDGRLGGVAINVGSGRSVSILVLAGKTRKLASPPAKVGFAERRPGDPEKTLADVGRARELLGFWARTPLANGLRKTWEWYQAADGKNDAGKT